MFQIKLIVPITNTGTATITSATSNNVKCAIILNKSLDCYCCYQNK